MLSQFYCSLWDPISNITSCSYGLNLCMAWRWVVNRAVTCCHIRRRIKVGISNSTSCSCGQNLCMAWWWFVSRAETCCHIRRYIKINCIRRILSHNLLQQIHKIYTVVFTGQQKNNIWLVRHLIKPTWCRVTSVCICGCVLLLLVLLAVTSSDSLAGDPMTSEPGNVLYWTPSTRPARDTLLSPNIKFYK
jgi:hypothetical protein